MPSRRLRSAANDQRGIALPLALILLTLLMSLTLAFLTMGATEPTIAANLKSGEMALAAAEAGIERAIWALSNPTVDTAGVNTKLNNLNAIPAAYSGGTLFTPLVGGTTYSVAITIPPAAGCLVGPVCLRADGYVVRNGVAVPAQPGDLLQADTAAHRVVRLQVTASGPGSTVGGPATPANVTLPGALTVAGTVQQSGNSLVDGSHQANGVSNNCATKAGITIRDKTTLPNGTVITNTVVQQSSAVTDGQPDQQTLTASQFNKYLFTDAQLAALKALAQSHGKYIQPSSNTQFDLKDVPGSVSGDGTIWGPGIVDGLMFVDTVNGQPLGSPPDASKLASVKITGANNSGWLIVMGSIRIDGNVTYNGLVYSHNDLSYKGTGTGGIFGAILSANAVDAVATVVDDDMSGNSKIYYDCNKVANGGGSFSQSVLDGLNRVIVVVTPGSWREIPN